MRLLRETSRAQPRTRNKRANEQSESPSGGSGGSRCANAVGRRAAGEEEHDDWKPVGKAGKSFADVVKEREKQLPIKPEGLHATLWSGTVVDLVDFISRVSTARTGDHIIAGVAAEELLELGGLLVPDGISVTLIAPPTMKTSHPTQELSAPTLCSREVW